MVIVYGAGKVGEEFIGACVRKGVVDFEVVDSDIKKRGSNICGKIVNNISEIDISNVELMVVSTDDFYEEIKSELAKLGYLNDIISYNEAVIITKEDILNTGDLRLKEEVKPGIYSYKLISKLFDKESENSLSKFFFYENHRLIHKFIHYFEAYDRFFSKFKEKNIKVLEIGVYRGGSLQMWKNYFGGKASIVGVDIDENCKNFEEEQIKIYIGNQSDKVFLQNLIEQEGPFDIIIDDGGHKMDEQIISFETLFASLNNEGIYLCEDTHTSYWKEYGGHYKDDSTFIEYSKQIVDVLHDQYFDSKSIHMMYRGEIKSISYFDSMVFIEKKSFANKSLAIKL